MSPVCRFPEYHIRETVLQILDLKTVIHKLYFIAISAGSQSFNLLDFVVFQIWLNKEALSGLVSNSYTTEIFEAM